MPTAIGTPIQGGSASQASPLNITHDSGTDQTNKTTLAVVFAFATSETVNAPTYGGNAMTAGPTVGTLNTTGIIRTYWLANPPDGSNTFSVTASGTVDELYAHVFSYYEVDQSTPFGTQQTNTVTGGTSLTIPSLTLGASGISIGATFGYSGGTFTITESDTLILETHGSGSNSGRATQVGNADIGWTFNTNTDMLGIGVPLNHSASASAPVISDATPSGTIGTTTTATIGATTDQDSGTIYAVVDTAGNISGITADQVKAGENNVGGAAVSLANASVTTTSPAVSLSGLSPATGYSYAVVQNTTNGDSNVLTGTFTTATAAILATTRQYGVQGSLRTIIGL